MNDFKILANISECIIKKWDLLLSENTDAFASLLIPSNNRRIFSTLFSVCVAKDSGVKGLNLHPFAPPL